MHFLAVEEFCQYHGKVSTVTAACSSKVCRSAEVQPETAVRVSVGGNISGGIFGRANNFRYGVAVETDTTHPRLVIIRKREIQDPD